MSSLPNPSRREIAYPVAIFIVAIIVRWLMQTRVAITDVDAESYIQGARSLRAGLGYVSAAGVHLNHWPPGYSFLLSLFRDPLAASVVINLISHGLAAALLWCLGRRAGWSSSHSLALAGIVSFGLFAGLTRCAKPDTLAYASFFAGVLLYTSGSLAGRVAACFVFCAVIPLKMIAVTFAPGLLLAELVTLGPRAFFQSRWKESIIGGCLWLGFLGGLLWYNAHTLRESTPTSYMPATLHTFMGEVIRFIGDFFRCGLASWYGSIRRLPYLITFAAVSLIGLACLATLRKQRPASPFVAMGLAILALSFGLECYRTYYAGPRLMGYGMLLVLIGLKPTLTSARLWWGYAAALLIQSVYANVAVSDVGENHPRYQKAALEAAALIPKGHPVYTNTWALLDVHAGIPSQVSAELNQAPSGSVYWELKLPNYDAIMTPINEPAKLDASWAPIATLADGRLYQKK